MVENGFRYRVINPIFAKTIGQGENPTHFKLNRNGQTLLLKWGETVEADDSITEMSMEIAGVKYVRNDIIETLLQESKPILIKKK